MSVGKGRELFDIQFGGFCILHKLQKENFRCVYCDEDTGKDRGVLEVGVLLGKDDLCWGWNLAGERSMFIGPEEFSNRSNLPESLNTGSLPGEIPQEQVTPATVETPVLYRLIALQKADGSWEATSEFATILGIPENFTESGSVPNVEASVWATVLAVIWLHSSCLDQREEWELLEGKSVSWVKARAGKMTTVETEHVAED
ncbi:PREDICTED: von Willebrand factor A domain-containing protein DDB_G0292740-like [Nanorana parkeri]|uniref:von Willebrand factor A domain-containing protein DDB_G0292740-like n=1 Tax=Nanorana parkeri TaxID=125878 RepID=UPI00085415D4|nr:PREDICTED: von Willebrand factor A domain-containing protein DDB_G0292740-like [Nanorana parkeri]